MQALYVPVVPEIGIRKATFSSLSEAVTLLRHCLVRFLSA